MAGYKGVGFGIRSREKKCTTETPIFCRKVWTDIIFFIENYSEDIPFTSYYHTNFLFNNFKIIFASISNFIYHFDRICHFNLIFFQKIQYSMNIYFSSLPGNEHQIFPFHSAINIAMEFILIPRMITNDIMSKNLFVAIL